MPGSSGRHLLGLPLALALLYALLGFALIQWVHRSLDDSAGSLAAATAELLGAELSRSFESLALDRAVDLEDRATRFELYTAVAALASGSRLVEAVEVVDADGRVAVANPSESIGQERSAPAGRFTLDRGVRLERVANRPGGHGYLVEVPLERGGAVFGSVRLQLAPEPFTALYTEARRRLTTLATSTFVVIVLLGFLLHLLWRRQRRALADTLQSALAGEPLATDVGDPLAPVFATASRLGLELHDARERSKDLERDLGLVEVLLEVGIMVLDHEGRLRFASPQARALVGDHRLAGLVADLHERLSEGEARFAVIAGDVELALEAERAADGDVVVVLRSASAARALETDLRLAAQRRVLMRLYRGFAHDLKAPLNAVVLNLELLRRALDPARPLEGSERVVQRERVEVVVAEIERLRRGFEALLAQTAPPDRVPVEVELGAVLSELEILLEPQARQQEVAIDLDRSDVPIRLRVFPDQLRQALLNLAVNALEAMPEGGRLRLATRVEGPTAIVSVSDSGGGIDESIRERLFSMHVSTKPGGSGIGLYTSQAIAAALGGEVRLAATGPAGVTFELVLPLV